MSSGKLVAACCLAACCLAAIALTACGGSAATRRGRGLVDDPRTIHVNCLKQHRVPVVEVGQTGLQIGTQPGAATVSFASTPGAAQELQISGHVTGAEVIGSALLYPNQASERQLSQVEQCLAQGVQG